MDVIGKKSEEIRKLFENLSQFRDFLAFINKKYKFSDYEEISSNLLKSEKKTLK